MLPRAIRTLDRAQPVFEYARSYTPDFAAWLTNFGQLPANYDANGHYARVQPMFLPTNLSGGTLTAATAEPEAQRLRHRQPDPLPGRGHPARAGRLEPGAGRSDCSTSQTPPGP